MIKSSPLLALLVFLTCAPSQPTAVSPEPLAQTTPEVPAPSLAAKPAGSARIPLTVRETAGVARAGEVIRSGVPLPRALGVRDVKGLAVAGPDGKTVPAEFRVLARWNAGKDDAAAPVQWLLAAFPASVPARGSAVYHLVTDGSAGPNPPPAIPLRLARDGRQVIVDTGAAVFRLGGKPGALLDEVLLPGDRKVVTGGELSLRAAGQAGGHSAVRQVRIESAGPLSAVVVVDGAYDHQPVGKGGFGSRRRYVFTAGSPTVLVRHAVAWEGNLACPGCLRTPEGKPNGVLVEGVRDSLALDLGGLKAATAVGDFKATLAKELGDGATAWVRQTQRQQRKEPLRFEAAAGGERREGRQADGGLLAVSGPAGTVAVALGQMHRYEPQALRLLPGGQLAVDVVDGKAWLANHQGLFANLAVAALPGSPGRPDLDARVWAPLNHPLRAWPSAEWFNGSRALAGVPAGSLPRDLAAYDELIPAVLRRTEQGIDAEGLAGVMTFGLYPRYWGERGSPGEIECRGDDPTPGEDWDETFWCGNWTDYHNTTETAAVWAMRSGEVEWLDRIAFPAALRALHTQVMQCSPEEKWFYCGQSPTGYGAYRADFNSSHAYLENLLLYYWLTGDSTVVDTLQRGGDNMRRYLCGTRGPSPVTVPKGPDGPACPPNRPPDSRAASLTGRVASQWFAIFRFLGHASEDPSFLDDFRSGLERAVTLSYAELEKDGKRYGFLGEEVLKGAAGAVAGPAWTNGFYDAENLYRLQLDTGDAAIGEPALRPSQVQAAMARTLVELGAARFGDGTPGGKWPRLLAYTWSGPRIGGALQSVQEQDRELYNPEKYGIVALLVRAGRQTGDPALTRAGDQMIRAILRGGRGEGVLPLGKIQGQTLTRLHAAVALAAEPAPTPP